MPGSKWKGTQDIQSPLCKGSWGHYQREILRRLPGDVAKALTLVTHLNVTLCICLYSWLVVTCTDNFMD